MTLTRQSTSCRKQSLASTQRPPRYKLVLLTWMAVCFLSSCLKPVLAPMRSQMPELFHTILASGITVVLLQYVIMPSASRMFHRWLYSKKLSTGQKP